MMASSFLSWTTPGGGVLCFSFLSATKYIPVSCIESRTRVGQHSVVGPVVVHFIFFVINIWLIVICKRGTTERTRRGSRSCRGTSRLFFVRVERTPQRVVGLFWWKTSRRLNEVWGFPGGSRDETQRVLGGCSGESRVDDSTIRPFSKMSCLVD